VPCKSKSTENGSRKIIDTQLRISATNLSQTDTSQGGIQESIILMCVILKSKEIVNFWEKVEKNSILI
jgi:hypothetical protein